jgi:hypothetical protein
MTVADYTGAVYDVRIVQGDDFVENLEFNDSNGSPIALSGYTFKSQVRDSPSSGVVAEMSIAVSGNVVTRSISRTITANMEGRYVQDFQWTTPQGLVRTLFSGKFDVAREVTR